MGKMLNISVDIKKSKLPIAKDKMHFLKSSSVSFCLLETRILVNLKLLFLYLLRHACGTAQGDQANAGAQGKLWML